MKNQHKDNVIRAVHVHNKKEDREQLYKKSIITLSNKLELSNNILTTILEISHEFMIFGLDTKYCYLSFNNQYKAMAKKQWDADIVIGMNILDIIENDQEYSNLKNFIDRVLKGEQFSSIEEYQNSIISKNYWSPIKNKQNEITGIICFMQNISDNTEGLKNLLEDHINQEETESLTFCDQLTGVYNPLFYNRELIRLNQELYFPLSIILISINSLTEVIGTYGHAVGDVFLKKAVKTLKTRCRGNDVVARLGNDLFVILMPRTEGAKVELAIERIHNNMNEVRMNSIKLSVSFGFYTKYEDSEDINHTFEMAKKQLEKQKRSDY